VGRPFPRRDLGRMGQGVGTFRGRGEVPGTYAFGPFAFPGGGVFDSE